MGFIFDDSLKFQQGRLCVMEQVERDSIAVDQVKEIMTVADTKEFFLRGVNAFLADPEAPADTLWQQIFREVPSTRPGETFPFRTPTSAGSGSHGIVFKRVGENGEIEFSRTSSTHRYVPAIKYATAFGYSNEWFEDGSMNLIEMVTEDFRDAANDRMAAIHYAAITSWGGTTTAVGGTTINDFINTLNARSVVMKRARRRPSIFLGAPEQEMFVRTAMSVRVANTQAGTAGDTNAPVPTEAISRTTPLFTEHLASGTGYLIEPRRRMISVNRQGLRVGRMNDLLHDGEVVAATIRRGVLIAESEVIEAISGIPATLPV